MKRFFALYKTDKLFFLGNIIGAIAKGALTLGKKLVTKIKDKREKKVAKAAEKLLQKKEKLAEAEQLIADSGVNGKGVSGFGAVLNMVTGSKATESEELATQTSNTSGGGENQMLKYGLIAIGALIALKALKIIK